MFTIYNTIYRNKKPLACWRGGIGYNSRLAVAFRLLGETLENAFCPPGADKVSRQSFPEALTSVAAPARASASLRNIAPLFNSPREQSGLLAPLQIKIPEASLVFLFVEAGGIEPPCVRSWSQDFVTDILRPKAKGFFPILSRQWYQNFHWHSLKYNTAITPTSLLVGDAPSKTG